MKLITGNSHYKLANSISNYLNIPLVDATVKKFSNGEINVKINESIRNEHIYIIQTGSSTNLGSINDHIMETLILIDACKRSNVKSITLIMPSYPYARQDKKDEPRVPITAKLMSNLYSYSGVNRMVSVDLHAPQIQGFFDIAFDNLYAIGIISKYLKKNIFNNFSINLIQNNYIFVSPDNGGAKRIMAYSKYFNINNVIMHKQRDYSTSSKIDKIILVGEFNLKDKTAIVIDDIMDTMGTMVKASKTLIDYGVKNVILVATHGIFSGEAINRINNCHYIKKVIVTNTLPQEDNCSKCSKLEVVDITNLLSQVINKIVNGESISDLFGDKSLIS